MTNNKYKIKPLSVFLVKAKANPETSSTTDSRYKVRVGGKIPFL
jgi:hypothetical protein